MARKANSDLTAWLEGLGLGQYAAAFRDNDIDAAVLCDLTAEDLRELGVDSVGHRRRILAAAAGLGGRAATPQPEAAPPEAAAGPQAAERRVVTVMFCDLVGSTEFAAAGDAEDYRDFIAQFRNDVEAAIHPFGATISQFLGDGIMASFGYPVASGHDAERAVAAGLAAVE
ncbi:MAG: AAA family ATPase, partial [Pseudomonadota bacterium]